MKKKFILFPLIAVLFYVILSSNASGPGLTSSTDATTGGCSCHNASATSTTAVSIQLKNGTTPVTTYVPGSTYTITLTGTQTDGSSTLPRYGFQAEVVNSGGSTAGSLTAPAGTHTVSPAGVVLVEHSSPLTPTSGTGGSGTVYTMNIVWTAPSSGAGALTLKGVINAVNYNGGADGGDKWNNTSASVNELKSITGSTPVCVGATITLANATTGGGTWSTGSANATISGTTGSSAVITGVTGGTAAITYTAGGSATTEVVTINALPTISGTPTACVGGTTTLSGSPAGGTWLSGSTIVATIGTSGDVTGVSGGTVLITYTATTGCQKVTTVSVIAVPPITGTAIVCEGSTTSLFNSASGGTWTSADPSIATVGSSSGVVGGVLAGTTTITYTAPSGCTTTTDVTVNATPPAIGGLLTVCTGATGTLTNSLAGGSWASSDGSKATIGGTTGIMTGVAAGTTIISYSLSTGCRATAVATVNQTPAAISGAGIVCTGLTATLSNSSAGGTWTSSDGSIASVDVSGIVTGGTVGTATITYTLPGGCYSTAVMTVTALPGPIGGTLTLCPSSTTTLTTTGIGGTWSSSNTSVATIGSASGVAFGASAGTATITYTQSAGCIVTATVTVNPIPSPITGIATVCVGSTRTLNSATLGGTWASSNANASIDISTGIVTGMAAGTSVITYTATTGCLTTTIVTVYPTPASISGTATVCAGLTTTFTNSTGGGTWTSSATGTATIGASSGIATGIAAGTATISYTLGTGCYNTIVVTVNPLPAGITGGPAVCVGSTITLADGTPGGTWSSGSGAISVDPSSGAVTGISANTATVTYTLPTSCRATTTVTVNPLPAALTGASTVCVGSNAAVIAPTGGGTWVSSNTAAVTISSAGVMTGIAAGTSTISYTLPTGCMRTIEATVNPLPATTTGTAVVCAGSTTALSNATTGGSWSSSSTSVATVDASTGLVSGIATGTATITYMLPTGCVATTVVTVNPLPDAGVISGPTTLCAGSTTALSTSGSGGTWSSSNTSIATISPAGVVNGVAAGTTTISYTASNSCGTATATKVMTITLTASAGTISGPGSVCVGATAVLTSSAGGGTWSSSDAAVASVVSSTGEVTGVTSGTALISYAVTGSCGAAVTTATITVNPSPAAISGPSTVCEGSTMTLTDAGGGTWASSNVSAASVGSSDGIVTGVTMGTTSITYSLAGCTATTIVTVNPIPSPISGLLGACLGTTTTLFDPTPGGTWSSSNTAVAVVGASSGVVTGLSAGTTLVSYTLATGCASTALVTINVTPAPITGSTHACVGATTSLSNSTTGGTWSSSNVLVATAAEATGLITGTSPGTTTITYALPTGCVRTTVVTVDASPSPISGATSVCTGRSLALTNSIPGGTWSSSTASVASVGAFSGIVTGVTPGTSVISYTMPSGCSAILPIVVNSSPAAITGSSMVCMGSATTLASSTTGGSWSSTNASVAGVVTTSGVVVPVSLGTATISYTVSNGCASTLVVTVNPIPAPITGSGTVCTGASTTLASASTGGTWLSSNPAVAVVSTSVGSVLGVAAGTTMITYTLTSGCNTTTIVTVNSSPGAITGGTSLCAGTTTTLGNSIPGGTWASSNTAVATVGAVSGVVNALTVGSTTISYTLPTGCRVTSLVTVNPVPSAISGTSTVCEGATITLSDATAGGSWSSSATATATVGSLSGIVTGVAAGTVDITYSMPSGCGVTKSVTVNPLPVPGSITGSTSVCAGSTITLTNPVTGGTWSASNGSAMVTADSGVVTGVTTGIDTIMYSVTNGCGTATASHTVVVTGLPNAGTISGLLNLCVGASSMLTSTGAFGVWSTSNTNATISTGGILTGVAVGTSTVSYTVTNACGTATSTATATILAPANAGTVTGADSVCPGATIHLSNAATGGIWAASNTNATVSSTGDVTGILSGSVSIMYIVINTCNVDTAAHTVIVKTAAQCINSVASALVNETLNIYPNPSQGSFVIDLPLSVAGGQVTVTDVTGRVVSQFTVADNSSNKVVVTMPDVAPGAYYVRIDSDGRSFRHKVVIVR